MIKGFIVVNSVSFNKVEELFVLLRKLLGLLFVVFLFFNIDVLVYLNYWVR